MRHVGQRNAGGAGRLQHPIPSANAEQPAGLVGFGLAVVLADGATRRSAQQFAWLLACAGLLTSGCVPVLWRFAKYWPHRRKTVPQTWLTEMPHERLVAAYGLLMGLGVATNVSTSLLFCLLAAATIPISPVVPVLAMATYGVSRAVSITYPLDHLLRSPRGGVAISRVSRGGTYLGWAAAAVYLIAAVPVH